MMWGRVRLNGNGIIIRLPYCRLAGFDPDMLSGTSFSHIKKNLRIVGAQVGFSLCVIDSESGFIQQR